MIGERLYALALQICSRIFAEWISMDCVGTLTSCRRVFGAAPWLAFAVAGCGGAHDKLPSGGDALGTDGVSADSMQPSVCTHPTLCLGWPLAGPDGRAWVINNYVDRDPGTGVLDYRGGAKTYDGHAGVDIDIANFPAMDAGVPVYAAAPGEVVSVVDGNPDRNTSCMGTANQVVVRHADGSQAIYAHLRTGSTAVTTGSNVSRGTLLGQVGSSGCSSGPHLHFQINDAANLVRDPFEDGMWDAPPVYDTPLGVMDVLLKASPYTGWNEAMDPAPNITSISGGSTLQVGVISGGGQPTDTLVVRLVKPGGGAGAMNTFTMTQAYRHAFWVLPVVVGTQSGAWTIEILTNQTVQATRSITVP